MVSRPHRLVAIVGPTGSGKTELALKVAQKLNGEVICADSRTVYIDADIGTSKPDANIRALVPHWGLDLLELGEHYTAHSFQAYAYDRIESIYERGKLPILAGGTGLYIDGVLYDFSFREGHDPKSRTELEKLTIAQLQQILIDQDLTIPSNSLNQRHLIRSIESMGSSSTRKQLSHGATIYGIWPEDEVLKRNIEDRVEQMYDNGFLEEVRGLLKKYPINLVQSAGIGYSAAVEHIMERTDLQEAKNAFKKGDWSYARRQRTWFKRNQDIKWFKTGQLAYEHIIKEFSMAHK